MHNFNDIILQILKQNISIAYFIPPYLECCFFTGAQKSRRILSYIYALGFYLQRIPRIYFIFMIL